MHLDTWSADHPVAHAIATGSGWMDAWLAQKGTPLGRLSKLTGIPAIRLLTIAQGDRVSRAEVDAVACAWSISSNDLLASVPVPTLVVD